MSRKVMATLIVFLLAFMAVGPTLADGSVDGSSYYVPTSAYVSSEHSSPIIKWKWELPDEDPYVPCTQIWPEPFGTKTVTTYIVATDDNGAEDIRRVFIKVFHPDGSEKYQIEAVELPKTGEIIEAIWAGYYNGCIPPEVRDDMLYELEKCTARAWKAEFIMDYHQPPGEYSVVAFAVDTAGAVGSFENTFTYYSLKYLAIDFARGVDFGELVPGVWKRVAGDTDMTTPNKPTVRSGGNDPLWIGVSFTAMVGEVLGKEITEFDAVFRGEEIVFNAGDYVVFENPLLPCHTEQIDFSVHPPLGTPTDMYTGLLYIGIADVEGEVG
ncbi:MAG: hypothetical protein QXX79_05580 [Candidatus Bathyarchaeia archaeon]